MSKEETTIFKRLEEDYGLRLTKLEQSELSDLIKDMVNAQCKQKMKEKKNILQEVLIKPECRKLHGTGGAFEKAVKKLIATYIMFAANNNDKTFKIQLVIKSL